MAKGSKKAGGKASPRKKAAKATPLEGRASQRAQLQPSAGENPTRRFIGERKLRSLLSSARAHQKQISGITGTLREEIANAVKNDHLHKGVFALLKQLDRKEPEDLALWIDHFVYAWEASGLKARADEVQRLDLAEGEEGGEEAAEGDDAGGDPDDGAEPPTAIQPAEDDGVSRPRFSH